MKASRQAGRLGAEIGAGDRHQPPAVGEARQRRCDVAIGGIGHPYTDIRHRRERRVHQHGGRRDGAVEVIVDLRRIAARYREIRKQMRRADAARVSASSFRMSAPPAISARMARRPVPADGSSTRSPGVTAAAQSAARPSGIGVENCWSAWLSSERRVWVGKRLASFANCGSARPESRLCGKAACRICAGTERSPPRRRHTPSSSPRRRRIGGAESRLHCCAQDGGIDAAALLEMGEKQARGPGEK